MGTTSQAQPDRPSVGAIRWDAWTGGSVTEQVERTLGPEKYHARLPWFAKVLGPERVRIDGSPQAIMDREIDFAADAGLDYWAFLLYPEASPMSVALGRYLASPKRARLGFCVILHNAFGVGDRQWPAERDRAVALLREPGYHTVLGGRPLVFAFALQYQGAFPQARFAEFRAQARAAGVDPYCVYMGWNPARDFAAMAPAGFDAVSAYARPGDCSTFADLAAAAETECWQSAAAARVPCVPLVTTGWDKRPRQEHPVSWEKDHDYHRQTVFPATATPAEIAAHLERALAFVRDHRALCPADTVVVYAWNEHDEGGWLAPTWTPAGKPNPERLDAIRGVLRPQPKPARATTGVYGRLRSFADHGLSDADFILRVAALLDPQRVPGLAEAVQAADAAAVLATVHRACGAGQAPVEPTGPAPDLERRANAILEHRFTFYDETHRLPAQIDWDHNPGTAHWGHDLNRFSFLAPLTDAYFATGDARYARKAVTLILDWIATCDMERCFTGTPYVFGSYLNQAIHCGAWAQCLERLLPHGQVQPLELLRVLKSLHDQLAYLEIVTNAHAGNWPTIGCMGMLRTLAVFPVLRDTARWTDYGIDTLDRQIADQVLPDGVQDELTPHYHQVVINNLATASASLQRLDRQLRPRTLDTLRAMVHYAQQTVVPDGSARVAFNDSDPMPGPNLHEQLRRTLERAGLAALLTPTADLGPECFPYAGVALLRQRPAAGDLYLAFDGGPFGRAHQHEDQLGFWLFAYGRNLLVDPGRHLYDRSAASFYPHLQTTRAHSTITIDGADQCSRTRRDTWIARQPTDLAFTTQAGEVRAAAAYDLGYGAKNEIAVGHRREIVFAAERFWVVFDQIEGAGEHLVESRFQFAPGDLAVTGLRALTTHPDANLLLESAVPGHAPALRVAAGQRRPDAGWFSPSYGHIKPAPTLTVAVRTALPLRMATLLYPFRGTAAPDVAFAFDGATAVVTCPERGALRIATRLAR